MVDFDENEVSQYDWDMFLLSNTNDTPNEYRHGDNYEPDVDDNWFDYDDDNYDSDY